mmetsp:Transcript_46486/g.119965  ORF Transcript_46486/g.119965 Transcript_46486/m.119965 type:complete len:270 (-) Transcript_46486:17-826(-)
MLSSIAFWPVVLAAISIALHLVYRFHGRALLLKGSRISSQGLRLMVGNREEKRTVAFVFAHPDDETMFFSPTILRIKEQYANSRILLICLSNGDYDGKGAIREKELHQAASSLGIDGKRDSVILVKDSRLQDGPHFWDEEVVKSVVDRVIAPFRREGGGMTLFTFDEGGVSGHKNHISVFNGCRELKKVQSDIKMFKLKSETLWRKYAGPSLVSDVLSPSSPPRLAVISPNPDRVNEAMAKHASQYVFFRRVYVLFSSYCWVNVWDEVE